jgi:hypothetical protein
MIVLLFKNIAWLTSIIDLAMACPGPLSSFVQLRIANFKSLKIVLLALLLSFTDVLYGSTYCHEF